MTNARMILDYRGNIATMWNSLHPWTAVTAKMLWLEMLIHTNAYAWGTQSEREGNNDYFTKLLFWQLQEGLCPHILLNLGRANSKKFSMLCADFIQKCLPTLAWNCAGASGGVLPWSYLPFYNYELVALNLVVNWQILPLIYIYTVSQKKRHTLIIFLYKSVKNELILIIFQTGTQNPEDISHWFWYTCPPHL